MKLKFTLVMAGKDTLEKKFEDAIEKNPALHMDIIRSFGQAIMLALRLNEADEITIESFRAAKLCDDQSITQKTDEKVVE